MLEMVCMWSFPAHRVGETYQGFLPRPMNFSHYVLDFWLQKCYQFVVCRMWSSNFWATSCLSHSQRLTRHCAASLPAFLALRWSKGSRPLLSMAPPSPSAYSCASCTTFGHKKVSFPLRQKSTCDFVHSEVRQVAIKNKLLWNRPVSLSALFTGVAISEVGQRY